MSRAVLLALALAGCTTEFEPQTEGRGAFSITGYVDGGASRQWVRVGRVRTVTDPDPTAPEAAVTLEDLATGQTWTMRDSLFTFANGYRATNFWADAEAVPGHRYRLVVEGPDGARATAEATVPEVPPLTRDLASLADPARYAFLRVDRVDDVAARYRCRLPGGRTETTEVPIEPYRYAGDSDVVVYWSRDTYDCTAGGGEVTAAEVVGTFYGDEWPDLREAGVEAAAVASVWSNVEGGVGFFGGAGVYRFPIFTDRPTL